MQQAVGGKTKTPLVPGLLADNSELVELQGSETTVLLKLNSVINEPIFVRNPMKIIGSDYPNDSTKMSWVTVSQTQLKLENVTFHGLIQATAKSELIAENCTFEPASAGSECAIEIFAQSSAIFTNCTFKNATQAALLVRDRSRVEVNNCTFLLNKTSSLLIMDNAQGFVKSSIFSDSTKFSVYVHRNSKASFAGCKFAKNQGKGIFALINSSVSIESCEFSECMQGGVAAAENSEIDAKKCKFIKIRQPSIHAFKGSTAKVNECSFMGSGINYDQSTGTVDKCQFTFLISPAFICRGPETFPLLQNCVINDAKGFAIVVRDCAKPSIFGMKMKGGKSHAFSISDYAAPRIASCTLTGYEKASFSVFNGATPEINGCTDSGCKQSLSIFTTAQPKIINCNLNSPINIHHRGILKEEDFTGNVSEKEGVFYSLNFKDGKFIQGDKCDKPTIPSHGELLTKFDIENFAPESEFKDFENNHPICMLCKKNPAHTVCVPCGHATICDECKEKLKAKPGEKKPCITCPLCQTGVTGFSTVFYNETCVCCLEKSDSLILPCGHTSVCYRDAVRSWNTRQLCPECRSKIISYRHVFAIV